MRPDTILWIYIILLVIGGLIGFLNTIPAGVCTAIGGTPLGGTNCVINLVAVLSD